MSKIKIPPVIAQLRCPDGTIRHVIGLYREGKRGKMMMAWLSDPKDECPTIFAQTMDSSDDPSDWSPGALDFDRVAPAFIDRTGWTFRRSPRVVLSAEEVREEFRKRGVREVGPTELGGTV